MKALFRTVTILGFSLFAVLFEASETGRGFGRCQTPPKEASRPLNVLVLLGEWFGDAYFPLKAEIESRGWTIKRVGLDGEYRGCYNKKRDVVLRSDIVIQDKMDLSGYDALIIPSGPQFRKFKENPAALKFVRDAHTAGLLIASFCVGNNTVRDAGLIDTPYGPALFPEKMTRVKERILLGPRGGGPPPGDGFESAPVKEICDAIFRELAEKNAPATKIIAGLLAKALPSGQNRESEKQKIAEVISSVIGWAKDKNLDLFFSSIAQDEDYISVTPGARIIKRFEDVKQNVPFWMSPEFKYVRHELKDLEITFARSGEVAWFYCVLDDINTYKSEPASWENARWTGVVEKRDGKWVVVSQHFSFAQNPSAAQKTPGATPEIFAPGIVSKEGIQTKLTMSADGSEIIYCERDPAKNAMLFTSRRKTGDSWGDPVVLPFSREYMNVEPSLSPDGKKLFFISTRPRSGKGEPEKMPDIWMSEKKGDQWGEPIHLGPPVNTADVADIEAHPFLSSDNKLYFMRQSGKTRRLFYSPRLGDQFQDPVLLPLKEDLYQGQFSGPCFSPDNRILIMQSRKDGGFGSWDLYISFKDESGGWGELVNLGPVFNTDKSEGDASFSPDGRYLFFTRDGDIFRISAKIVEDRRVS